MNPVDAPELALARKPETSMVSIELVRRQKSAAAAFALACTASGLEDKEIYLQLGIDAGTFSRIKKGEANFPPDKLAAFCLAVGNLIYPEWQSYQVGCTLVQIEGESARLLRIEREARAKTEAENALLRGLLVGRTA